MDSDLQDIVFQVRQNVRFGTEQVSHEGSRIILPSQFLSTSLVVELKLLVPLCLLRAFLNPS